MSKRYLNLDSHDNNNNNNNNNNKYDVSMLTRDKAEQMCEKKLRQVKKVKSKLYETVLVRNTLRYVQSSDRKIFSCVTESEEYYVPFSKKSCIDLTCADIDNILCDISFQPADICDISFQTELSEKRLTSIGKQDSVQTWQNAFSDSVVPENEMCKDTSDEDYIDELLRNRTNCTITKFTMENRNNTLNTIWHSPIY